MALALDAPLRALLQGRGFITSSGVNEIGENRLPATVSISPRPTPRNKYVLSSFACRGGASMDTVAGGRIFIDLVDALLVMKPLPWEKGSKRRSRDRPCLRGGIRWTTSGNGWRFGSPFEIGREHPPVIWP